MAHRSSNRRTQRKAKQALRWSENKKPARGAIPNGFAKQDETGLELGRPSGVKST